MNKENKKALSEMDEVLLKRYGLLELLEDYQFINYIALLMKAYVFRYGTGVPLYFAVEVFSKAIKIEPIIMKMIFTSELKEKEIDRILQLLILAAIEKMTNKGYLESSLTEKEKKETKNK